MNKLLLKLGIVLVIVALLSSFAISCERIDAGHVGVRVELYGTEKGVNPVTECTGLVFYSPISTKIYEFPTYVQHKEYTKNDDADNSFVVNTKDGSEFHVSPVINYSVQREKVPAIFSKYRRSLPEIEEGFLKTTVYDAFRLATNSYTAEELVSNRANFEIKVRSILKEQLQKEGFVINTFTSNLVYPTSFKNAINAKNNTVQAALQAENKVKQAEAEAKIKVATAAGDAEATLTRARAEAEANSLKQRTLTPMLLQQQWIEAWRRGGSQVPVYMANGGEKFLMNIK